MKQHQRRRGHGGRGASCAGPRVVGTFPLGGLWCELACRPGAGGEFDAKPAASGLPRITVGLDYTCWSDVLAVLLHEALELALHSKGCRLGASSDCGRDSSEWTFVVGHVAFADAVARVAEFVDAALPALRREWRR